MCLADGSEAVVGVKADVEEGWKRGEEMGGGEREGREDRWENQGVARKRQRRKGTVSVNVDLPGFRDDDALPTYLAAMIKEGLVSGGDVEERLGIRGRFAWKLYVDVCSMTVVTLATLRFLGKINTCASSAPIFNYWI